MAAAVLLLQFLLGSLAHATTLEATLQRTNEMAQFVPNQALQILQPLEAQARAAAPEQKVEYLTQLSIALRGAGQVKEALAVAEEVIAVGRAARNDVFLVKGLLAKAYNLFSLGDLRGSHQFAREAERVAAHAGDAGLLVQATISSGQSDAEEGNFPAALAKLQKAADLARATPHTLPKLKALNALAVLYGQTKSFKQGFAVLDEAYRVAAETNSPARTAMLKNTEYALAIDTDQPRRALAALETALQLQRQIGARRMLATTLVNLSDSYLKAGQLDKAIEYGNQALEAARSLKDESHESTALANIGQAQIATGKVEQGKRNFERGLASYEKAGDLPELQIALQEYGMALERAGDAKGAIKAYHRERELSEKIFADERAKAVWELQEKYEAANRERRIDILRRDNTIQAVEIRNKQLERRVMILLACIVSLGSVVVWFLYQKVRRANAHLKLTNLELEYKSSHDLLTGLYNRRYLQEYVAARSQQGKPDAGKSSAAAIFIVDIDHFKKINDTRGHACGDAVLVEVAKRLRRAVRGSDLIVRWGGEEFVVYAPDAQAGRIDEVAQRLLDQIGGEPVNFNGEPMMVTASVGYAPMCLTPEGRPMTWEEAIHLVDKALYLAKANGRNRAYGMYGGPGLTAWNRPIKEAFSVHDEPSENPLLIKKKLTGPEVV